MGILKNKTIFVSITIIIGVSIFSYLFINTNKKPVGVDSVLAIKFDELSQHGNSSCSASFQNSIAQMPDDKPHSRFLLQSDDFSSL